MAKANIAKPLSGSVVGTIHSPGALAAARAILPGSLDYLEIRVDAFSAQSNPSGEIDNLRAIATSLGAPLIITVRHPKEGGAAELSVSQRLSLFDQFLGCATLIDVELRSAAAMAPVLAEAKERGIGVILSHHDFRTTPSLARLEELRKKARQVGCTVFKLAAVAPTPQALSTLLQFLTSTPQRLRAADSPALSVMGMGEFGKLSRLVLGRSGSVLNYGFLDTVQVSGQWPAEVLKQRLSELWTREP